MCEPVSMGIMAAAAVAGAAQSYQSGQDQKKAAKRADANAKEQASLAEQDMNKRNAKQPNVGALTSQNQQAAQAGPSGTSLTGPAGIDPSVLYLGKNTVLGN